MTVYVVWTILTWLGNLSPTAVALIGTIFGGVGLKFVEHWLSQPRFKITDSNLMRDELRSELSAQKAENNQLEKDVDKWRSDYYDMRDKLVKAETEIMILKSKMDNKDL